jgi:cold shock CspA family protein
VVLPTLTLLTGCTSAQREFFEYILDQDSLFFRLPKDGIYEGQRQLREELRARWVDQRSAQTPDPETETVPAVETDNFSQKQAEVTWYDPARGFGFAEAGLSQSIFIHRSVLEQSKIETLDAGDRIICDITPNPKGKLMAIAIHSVQKSDALEDGKPYVGLKIEGVIEFWNPEKGYGFVKASNLPEDAYISRRSSGGVFADRLRQGVKVKAAVARQRFGKFSVTTIESVG